MTSYKSLKIVHEDSQKIICFKPAGIPTQTANLRSKDMVTLIKTYLYKKNPSAGEPYLGVIHRLDQPVSGLLVFAKTAQAAASLSKQLQDHAFGKYYKALVATPPKLPSGTLVDYLLKDSKNNLSHVVPSGTTSAKKAILHYQSEPLTPENRALFIGCNIVEGMEYTVLSIKLETGRHHQIRLQLAHLGCPILGDTKYNNESSFEDKWQNIALCAYKLEFKNGEVFEL